MNNYPGSNKWQDGCLVFLLWLSYKTPNMSDFSINFDVFPTFSTSFRLYRSNMSKAGSHPSPSLA